MNQFQVNFYFSISCFPPWSTTPPYCPLPSEGCHPPYGHISGSCWCRNVLKVLTRHTDLPFCWRARVAKLCLRSWILRPSISAASQTLPKGILRSGMWSLFDPSLEGNRRSLSFVFGDCSLFFSSSFNTASALSFRMTERDLNRPWAHQCYLLWAFNLSLGFSDFSF